MEPGLHGGMASIDEMLKKFDTALRETFPTEDTWGEGPEAEENAALLEAMYPPAAVPQSEQPTDG